jgi:hypothetical protein
MRLPLWLALAPALLLVTALGCRPRQALQTPTDLPARVTDVGPESTVLRAGTETVLEQSPSTAEVESLPGGAKRVTVTDARGGKSTADVSTESAFTAETVDVPLPPKAKSAAALRLDDAKLNNPMLAALDVAGMRTAIYTVAGTTVDKVLEFYTKHKSGRFTEFEDARPLGLDMVIVSVKGNEDVNVALVPEGSGVTLMVLDQSKTKLAKNGG